MQGWSLLGSHTFSTQANGGTNTYQNRETSQKPSPTKVCQSKTVFSSLGSLRCHPRIPFQSASDGRNSLPFGLTPPPPPSTPPAQAFLWRDGCTWLAPAASPHPTALEEPSGWSWHPDRLNLASTGSRPVRTTWQGEQRGVNRSIPMDGPGGEGLFEVICLVDLPDVSLSLHRRPGSRPPSLDSFPKASVLL